MQDILYFTSLHVALLRIRNTRFTDPSTKVVVTPNENEMTAAELRGHLECRNWTVALSLATVSFLVQHKQAPHRN